MKLLPFVAALLTVTAHNAGAASPYFKAPFEWAGAGCPSGTISVVGENSPTLTVMFDKYDAGNGMPSQSGQSRVGCSFAVPIHVPKGFQLSKVTADWMGYTKGSTKLKRKYFFAQQPQTTVNKVSTFPPPNGNDFTVHDTTPPYSTCKNTDQLLTFRVNSSVEANGNPSFIVVDSVDMNNHDLKVILNLQWVTCP
jgi:hypothetical protein